LAICQVTPIGGEVLLAYEELGFCKARGRKSNADEAATLSVGALHDQKKIPIFTMARLDRVKKLVHVGGKLWEISGVAGTIHLAVVQQQTARSHRAGIVAGI
jgi:hypothetical protein